MEYVPCGQCGGCGWVADIGCCGNLTSGGECRGDCAIQIQRECDVCMGCGNLGEETTAIPREGEKS